MKNFCRLLSLPIGLRIAHATTSFLTTTTSEEKKVLLFYKFFCNCFFIFKLLLSLNQIKQIFKINLKSVFFILKI